ncbi:unnamed protein product, partial [Mesorhabditis belari]|uniref:C2H2-type domain-containing protein n=1 Tax=Mesorhabditis belari TaxID=2138241 RepID=A0AAF3FDU4_9BILA
MFDSLLQSTGGETNFVQPSSSGMFLIDEDTKEPQQSTSEIFLIDEDSKNPPSSTSSPPSWVFCNDDLAVWFSCLWHSCTWTSRAEDSMKHFENHISAHIESTLQHQSSAHLFCGVDTCQMGFSNTEDFRSHVALHVYQAYMVKNGLKKILENPDFSNYESCNFPRRFSLFYGGEPIKCEFNQCPFEFRDISEFVKHVNRHVKDEDFSLEDGEKVFTCKWLDCAFSCSRRHILRDHLRHHSGEKIVACPFCGQFFTATTKLFDHLFRKVEGDLVCSFCRKKFADTRLLRKHCQNHRATCQCPHCKVVFKSNHDLLKHIQRKHVPKTDAHQCGECGKFLATSNILAQHMATHQEPTLKCDQCDKMFRWKKQLANHKKEHEKDSSKDEYACHLCNQLYTTGTTLTKHLKTKHDHPLPSGFSKFQYKKCTDGLKRLQTTHLVAGPLAQAMIVKARLLARPIQGLFRRTLLSSSFSLNEAWAERHQDLNNLGLGGDYEWIASVQKKFIGGGVGSAVDVDAAACVAEHKDQVNDILDLVYKLRHSPSAADFLSSTEYAIMRLLLKHEPDRLLALADDPINYGIFLNEHAACLAIDHFLKASNIPVAARLSAWIMLQEMTDNQLLNLLCIYSTARWCELNAEERIMPLPSFPDAEEEINEEDVKTLKFPWLKNETHDGHFDINDASQLAGKTLLWIGRESKLLDESTRRSVMLLGACFMNDYTKAISLLSDKNLPAVNAQIVSFIEAQITAAGEGAQPTTQQQNLLEALKTNAATEGATKLSDVILEVLKKSQVEEEKLLATKQTKEFGDWGLRRKQLVDAQAERALLKVKLEQINAELQNLDKRREKLSFFENRLTWEKRAEDNDQIKPVEGKKRAASG